MPLKDLGRLVTHWRKHPPAHLAIAALEQNLLAAQGITLREPERQSKPGLLDEAEVRSFVAQLNGA